MNKKLLALALAALLALSMAACGGSSTTEPAEEETVDEEGFKIGVVQLVEHVALDAATQGFKDAVEERLSNVEITVNLAQGEANNCATIVNNFVSSEVDLIMANATPALQAAVAGTDTIPILGTSITEYGTALELKDFNGICGGNVSGTSDLAPLDQQAAMVKELFPDAKTVGLLYCSAEANSQYQVDVVSEELENLGYEARSYAFADSNDIAAVVNGACSECDVLYIPTDNTAASNTGIIDQIALEAGVPIVASEEGICSGCGVATLSISYYDIGYQTGVMAAEILAEGADISTMPIAYAPKATKKYDAERCEALGIEIPEGYEAI